MSSQETPSYHIKIRELRRQQGLSQNDLAHRLGVSRQTVVAVETGRSQPSLMLALKFSAIFDSAIEEMFSNCFPKMPKIINPNLEEKYMPQISVWHPLHEVNELHRELDRIFNESVPQSSSSLVPAINVHENENSFTIEAAIPGYKEDEIQIETTDNLLTLKGEKKNKDEISSKNWVRQEYEHTSFERSFRLPDEVDQDTIEAKITDGVLHIKLPKITPEKPKVKKIQIKKVA